MKNVVKGINRNFTGNKLNVKNPEHPFVKKLICEHLTSYLVSFEFFWEIGAYERK